MKNSKWAGRWSAYRRNVALLVPGMALAWRNVPHYAALAWRELRRVGWPMAMLLLSLLGPVMALLAPVLAVWGVISDERAAAKRPRRPFLDEADEHETHCGCSDCW